MQFWERNKSITTFYESCTKSVREYFDLTQMQFDVLMFLHNNPQFHTAAEIVKLRRLTKSHVSAALRDLEERGLISTTHTQQNRKSRHIALMDPAREICVAGLRAQEAFGRQLLHGFSQDEMELCRTLFLRMVQNAEIGLEQM